jgi:NADH dehydrogenase [ubiquinone] 1 alpha subcomplex assembly factor 2
VQFSGSLGSHIPGRIHPLLRCVFMFRGEAVSPEYFLQELQADLERQRRVLHNAAILQARDQEERARVSAVSAPSVAESPPLSTAETIPTGENMKRVETPEPPPHSSHPIDKPRPSPNSELPPVGKGRDWQPEAWTPQTTRRRGG